MLGPTQRVIPETGLAVCDTDPLTLHYDCCLARLGAASWERFDCGVAVAEAAITEQRLGIADLIVVHLPDDQTLARRRDFDGPRRRRNFELHRRLTEPLRDWYQALDQLEPGRVRWGFPNEHPTHVHPNLRARHRSLRLPDALVLATAARRSVDELITTDRTWPTARKLELDFAITLL